MLTLNDPNSPSYARLTGCLYLLIAVSGGFSIAYIPSALYVIDDAAASARSVIANRGLFHAGIAGDVIMMSAELAVTAMLFFMFRHVNSTLALIAAFARFAMVAVMATMLLFHVAMLSLADETAMSAFTSTQRLQLAGAMLRTHDAGVWVWQIFFTVHLWVLGTLILGSKQFPSLLGFGLIIGGTGYLLDSIFVFAFPEAALLGHIRTGMLVTVTVSELGFTLWLLVKGPRAPQATLA
jgi:hypothetical protein